MDPVYTDTIVDPNTGEQVTLSADTQDELDAKVADLLDPEGA